VDSGKLDPLPAFLERTDVSPRFRGSPDGAQVVFIGKSGAADRSNTSRLWVLDLHSQAAHEIGAGINFSIDFAWRALAYSPDGASVLTLAAEGDVFKIVSVPVDGRAPHELLTFPSTAFPLSFDVAPDGSIYLDQMVSVSSMLRFPEQGTSRQESGSPTMFGSPQGNGDFLLSVRHGSGSRLMFGRFGAEPRLAVETAESTAIPGVIFGSKLAFIIGAGDARRIAIASVRDGHIEQRFPEPAAGVTSIAASPDGATLYYSLRGFIWAQPLSGGGPRRIAEGTDVAADPSGRYVYVKRNRQNAIQMFRIPTGGGPEEILPVLNGYRNALAPLAPASVDARGRVLVTVLGPDSFYYRLAIADPVKHTATLVPLDYDGDVMSAVWLPDGRISAVAEMYRHSIWHYTRSGRR
jgi:hypothetical protein